MDHSIRKTDSEETQDLGCHWDPQDPRLCFDEHSCGCYMDPCEFFNLTEDCASDNAQICCTLIETC